ncbi:unnamed protein product [Schistosoma margrebowiei]|uniref:Uncharacterized protein n=1 Tax=Schistosoma margrebowiei TaxID=48269 RepID=A0A183N8I5_9TREM|nr:unnamed protein product [Schistosoma margrebowiei]
MLVHMYFLYSISSVILIRILISSCTVCLYQVLYQIGVFLSRSSVSFIQFKTTWIMSLLQVSSLIFFFPCLINTTKWTPYSWSQLFQ